MKLKRGYVWVESHGEDQASANLAPAYLDGSGLAITKALSGYKGEYTPGVYCITHIPTGWIVKSRLSLTEARRVLPILAAVTDWWKVDRNPPRELGVKVREALL